ncbi:MAG: hypothetical protein IJU60_03295 [Acholeplasmatales bacterium]|nr:hypothetical protein [Acholeplasmatales bacterium]
MKKRVIAIYGPDNSGKTTVINGMAKRIISTTQDTLNGYKLISAEVFKYDKWMEYNEFFENHRYESQWNYCYLIKIAKDSKEKIIGITTLGDVFKTVNGSVVDFSKDEFDLGRIDEYLDTIDKETVLNHILNIYKKQKCDFYIIALHKCMIDNVKDMFDKIGITEEEIEFKEQKKYSEPKNNEQIKQIEDSYITILKNNL